MTEPFYRSRGRVFRGAGGPRAGATAPGTRFEMGVHGPIREHYRIDARELPLPVDYIVAATGG